MGAHYEIDHLSLDGAVAQPNALFRPKHVNMTLAMSKPHFPGQQR